MPDPFVEQLNQLCRDHQLTPKWVVLPAPGIGWTLGERLLLEGCSWINLHFTTPFQLALEACAPELLGRGVLPCPEGLGPGLLQTLLLRLPDESNAYFRPLILQPGMARALWNTLMDFRLTGLKAARLLQLFPNPKRQELHALFAAYEQHLLDASWADRADILSTTLPVREIDEQDLVIPYPYANWSPLEASFLARLPGIHRVPHGTHRLPPESWPIRIAKRCGVPPRDFYCATRRHEEIDEVCRRIETGLVALDQVEICALPEEALLIRERLARVGFPCTFEAGLPVLSSRPGQGLRGLLQWIEHGFTAYHLRELLVGDLLRAPPNSFSAARLLQSARISWGRETYAARLAALQRVYESRQLDEAAANCQVLSGWVCEILEHLPAADSRGEVDAKRWLSGLQEILRSCVVVPAGDEDALESLLYALGELRQLPVLSWPVDRLIQQVRQRISELTSGACRAQAGKIHVTRPSTLGLTGRPEVYLIGLEEGRWLTTQPEDCVLDDQERAMLHPGLRKSCDLPEYMLFQLQERMDTVAGRLTLSYALHDRGGEQNGVPSWIFFQAARAQDPSLSSYHDLSRWVGDPVPRSPVRRIEPRAVAELYPNLNWGLRACEERDSPEVGDYDGFVPEAAGLWDPRLTGKPVSVSRLTALATCPFQVFLEEGLRLARGAPRLPDPDIWLDPLARGLLIHEVLAAYGRRVRAEKTDPTLLHQLLHEHLERVQALSPPPSAAQALHETLALERDLEYFLRMEALEPGRVPVGMEVAFGLPSDEDEPLATVEPVWLQLADGSTIAVCGRIDRIDRLSNGFAVVDYKTGKSLRVPSDARYDRGRLLQHAIYALVVEQLAGPVAQTSYCFVAPGAVQPWLHFDPPCHEQFTAVLNRVLEPLRSGVFLHTHERANDCRFCDFRPACASQPEQSTRLKLDNPANTLLDSRRQLLEDR